MRAWSRSPPSYEPDPIVITEFGEDIVALGGAGAEPLVTRLTALVQLAIKSDPDARTLILAAGKPVASDAAFQTAAKPEKTTERNVGTEKETEEPTLLQWRFNPGTFDGHALPVFVTVELTFTLH